MRQYKIILLINNHHLIEKNNFIEIPENFNRRLFSINEKIRVLTYWFNIFRTRYSLTYLRPDFSFKK